MRWRIVVLFAAILCLLGVGSALAQQYEVYAIQYSRLENYPADAMLFSTDRGKTLTVPFSYCLIKGGGHQYLFDTGYSDMALGMKYGAPEGAFSSLSENLGKLGTSPDKIEWAILGHMHWDHAGGTMELPNAKFIVQKKEIEFAAGEITQKKHTMAGFNAPDILNLVKLNWEGRVKVVDGDTQNVLPGISVYLTPGHTAGTESAMVSSRKGNIVLAGDSVYMYRNIDEMIPLGFGYNLTQMLDSFEKVKTLVGAKGTLVPGHDAAVFSGKFPKVADNIARCD